MNIRFLAGLFLAAAVFPCLASAEFPGGEAEPHRLFIREYRIQGASLLDAAEIERIVYPYLGPERTYLDVDAARAALEAAYHEKGYQTVYVEIPSQRARRGVVILRVHETEVGRLRVRGSRYTDPDIVREAAPSMAEGVVPNFHEVTRDVVALNRHSERSVTPELRQGLEAGTVDIDLIVDDRLPLHGSIELNNRRSANTTELRLNASLSYANLWQAGHGIGGTVQVAPLDLNEVKVFSGHYLVRGAGWDRFTFMVQGTRQDSNVATLGNVAVAGRGHSVGVRGILALPEEPAFHHSLSFGIDRRSFRQLVTLTDETLETPITYYPINVQYTAFWSEKGNLTELHAGPTFHIRGWGSSPEEWDANRYRADGSFISIRGEVARTQTLANDAQLFGRLHGQLADGPLVSSEQFGGGGQGTVRGYLEAEVMGDQAVLGSVEARSPKFPLGIQKMEWRVHAFADGGFLLLRESLPEQDSRFSLASFGVGSTFRYGPFFSGAVELGVPLFGAAHTEAWSPRVLFRATGEF